MNTRWIALALALLAAAPLAAAQAQTSRIAMGEATAARQAQTEESARQTVQSLFERLCPGRCEIIQLSAVMGEPAAAALVEPGFEEDAPQAYEGQVSSLRVDILLDSQLPGSFRQSIPRMLRYRLSSLSPVVEVRTETLAFPEPQLEPAPPVLRDPPRSYAPPPPLPRMPEPPPEEERADPAPEPAAEVSADDLWTRAIPWIGGVLIALILAALILILLRRLTQRSKPAADGAVAHEPAQDLEVRGRARRELEDALRDKRAVANAALRRWVLERPEAVARFVKLFGAETLKDLRSSDEAAPALARVARHLVAHPEPLTDAEEGTILQEARARFAAAELEDGRSAEWEFLEGLSSAQLQRLLADATISERACVLAELPASARSGFVAALSESERAELLLGASGAQLGPTDVRRLQSRLRSTADGLRGQRGVGAGGGLIGDLIRTVPASEQADLARRLLSDQPEAGEALLEGVLLEGSLAHLPSGVLGDASMQVPIETLVTFLGGTEPATRDVVLAQLSPRTRSAVSTELGVSGPVARQRFFDAREALVSAVADVMLREGGSLRGANAHALRTSGHGSHNGAEHLEAAQ